MLDLVIKMSCSVLLFVHLPFSSVKEEKGRSTNNKTEEVTSLGVLGGLYIENVAFPEYMYLH